jgi:hypothetical protein
MQEVVTKTIDLNVPSGDREFYELCLLDEANDLGTRHHVRQTRFGQNETYGDFMPDPEEVEYFWNLDEAKVRYEQRRQALVVKGYTWPDMDLF